MLALVALAMGLTMWAQQSAIGAGAKYDLAWRLKSVPIAYVTYLGKFFWPVGLAGFIPAPTDFPLWQSIVALAILAAVTAAAAAGWRRFPYLPVGWLWFLGMSVPVIGFIQLGVVAVADRNTYLPQIGLAIAVAWRSRRHPECGLPRGERRFWPFVPQKQRDSRGAKGEMPSSSFLLPPWLGAALAAAIGLAILSAAAWRQTAFWRNSETLWNRALACTSGNLVAHTNLGVYFGVTHRPAQAVIQLQRPLAIDPKSKESLFSLGTAYFDLGQFDKAETNYRRAIELDPNLPHGRGQLGPRS